MTQNAVSAASGQPVASSALLSLLIDTPRWRWRGRLWAHLISDTSADELHGFARLIGLRYMSFGLDHYDVPEELWPAACEVATLVDPRDIVRSLRLSGLRVPGGKAQKHWVRREGLPPGGDPALRGWTDQVLRAEADLEVEVLSRPGELVVLAIGQRPADRVIQRLQLAALGPSTTVVTEPSTLDPRWSMELVASVPVSS